MLADGTVFLLVLDRFLNISSEQCMDPDFQILYTESVIDGNLVPNSHDQGISLVGLLVASVSTYRNKACEGMLH